MWTESVHPHEMGGAGEELAQGGITEEIIKGIIHVVEEFIVML